MAAPTTVEEQELDKLTNPAEAGSIEQTIKIFPDASKLDPNKTQGRHHRTLLTSLLTRTKAWVKVLYDKQNYAGPYRAGTVTAGDMHWTKTTTELTIWKAIADFTAAEAPTAGAQWEQFAVLPVAVTPQDFTDIEARLLALETAMASDDPSLDTIQEIVTYIKDNRASLQTLGGVLDGIIEVTDEIDLRLIEAEAAIIALQQVVASNDPNLDTIQKIVNYIKSTTPGTTGSVGSIPTWIVTPRVTVDASLNVVVLNQSPNEPTADWNDQNLVFGTGIIFPTVVPPAEGIYRTDAIDAAPNGIYEHVKGEESPTAAASPALLNNRLRAAYIIWAGSTGTVTYPEGGGYWGDMPRSSTDAMTIEEYFLSLTAPKVDYTYYPLTAAAALTANYVIEGKERPNQRLDPATVNTITVPDLPEGKDMRFLMLNPAAKVLQLGGAISNTDLFGETIAALTLTNTPRCVVLVNRTHEALMWSVLGKAASTDGGGTDTNAAPTANAGTDQTVTEGSGGTITGSGTDTDGTIASYAWAQVSGPNTATLTNANTATLGYSSTIPGTYVFRLTVTDNEGATATDDVSVTVNAAGPNTAPTITLSAPNPYPMMVGEVYTEPGYTATDAQDGDLYSSVQIESNLDTTRGGVYAKVYSVTDSGGFTDSETRTIEVNETRLQLSGTASGVDLSAHMVAFNALADTVTIEGWFRSYDDLFTTGTSNAAAIFAIQNDNQLTTTTSDFFQISYGNGFSELENEIIGITRADNYAAAVGSRVRSSAGYIVSDATEYTNTDIHVALAIGPGLNWRLYVNGKQVQLTAIAASDQTKGFLAGLDSMVYCHLGTRYLSGARSNSLHGEMWNWRIWNVLRTPEQIAADMYAAYQPGEPGLVEQWLIRDASGTIAHGVNDKDGIILGGTWTQTTGGGVVTEPVQDNGVITGETYTGTTLQ